jgi:hypothetical protein
MNKARLSIRSAVILVYFACAPSPAQVAKPISLAAGSTIPLILEKWVDARKNKVGDKVSAETKESVKSEGQVVIPRGSKIVGYVTEARAKANTKTKEESESAVGIALTTWF